MSLGGLRGRLAVALVGIVALTVIGIGLGTYAFVDARLRDGLLADASRQAQFNLSVLVPDRLPANAGVDAYRVSGLPEAFRLRGDEESIVDFGNDQVYVSSDALAGALATLPASLTTDVQSGHLAYAWLPIAGAPALVVGGRQGSGPTFYFVFRTSSIDEALDQLRLGLIAAAVIAVLVALVAARLIARRILEPVGSGSVAAARIAAGDLTARVPEAGSDELAAFGREFNRMAAALEETVARLEDAQQQNRRFVADVSHELRTPLAALVAEASIIDAGLDRLPADSRRAAELLVADVRRLRGLVEDLMELSRFDAEAEEPALVPLDLGATVGSIVRARLPEAALHLPDSPLVVQGEVRRLDRIVGNLLDNARTHAPGSQVDVTVRVGRPAEDIGADPGPIASAPEPSAAEVVVGDRGPGVDEVALDHLFERFYKADASRGYGSSGLGLAIAAEHARLLGGTLRARGRAGGGLEVSLRLPVTGSLPEGR